MARRDGEDWLEGRPDAEPSEGSREARLRLRDPLWWLVVALAVVLTGGLFGAVGAALGDGSFDLDEVINNSVVGFISLAVGTAILAARI